MRRLQIKFPNQIRISGWDFGSSARAMNQAGGNISTQADLEKVSKSTTERKSMSTKTTIKRIALVAVATLGLGVVSSVSPASAAISVAYTNTYDTTNGYGVVGGTATATFTLDASTNYSISVGGVGSVLSADPSDTHVDWVSPVPTTTNTVNDPNYNFTSGRVDVDSSGGDLVMLLTSSVAGAQTITFTPIASGIPGTAVTKTFTWVASTSTALSAENSIFTISDTAAHCASSTSQSNDATNALNNAVDAGSYRQTAAIGYPCLIVRDGNGNRVASLDSQVWSLSGGSFASGSLSRAVTSSSSGTGDGAFYNTLYGDSISKLKGATLTVTAIKGSASFSKSVTFDLYGKIASISLTAGAKSLAAGTAGADYLTGTSATTKAQTTAMAYLTCLDSNGVEVVDCDYDGDGTGDSTDAGYFYVTGDSDKVTGAPTFVTTSPADNIQAGAPSVDVVINQTGTAVGEAVAFVQIDNSSDTTADQKVTYTVHVKDAATTGTPATINANQDFYVSGALATIEVIPSVTEGTAGEAITVNVSAKDANGYPVADATSITLLASNGGTVAPNTKTTSGGVFTTAATAILGQGNTSITAVSGTKQGTALVTVTGGSGEAASNAVDAANEATDAANAATDAANAAAEAADAATAAAQDAQAAVAELATKVASLMAGIKAQITSLTNLVIKIQKKVRA